MKRSSPWSNELKIANSEIINNLYSITHDKGKEVILGSRLPLGTLKTTIMVGTDVSGEIHLGHAALLCVADFVSKIQGGKITVSINELESVLSRKRTPQAVVKNQGEIMATLKVSSCNIHSRLNDPMLILFSTYLWNYLLTNSSKHGLFKYYEHQLSPQDILSVAIMASTPLVLAIRERTEAVLAIYGVDEFAHLELMNQLYHSVWFKKEAKKFLDTEPPEFNYLLIKTLPDKTGKYKMSKSRPLTTIFINKLTNETIIKEVHILDYLEKLCYLIKTAGVSVHNNIWYNIIKQAQNGK